ncbi:MAG: Methionine aminopeptidase [Candidatus Amesbacteria bacterium GW2011_GWC1_47_15]|uniref:Methionine aminopeptidase n=1 Tax=Candidatus Amesbacteria bacterium GW2011_GWC1_47_15 TaxID=1618364 RepID=A0A0G1RZ32_9BACT|nr:MAG: Methionine aminopeptidase [Candidatus Amesbacteria bacterium GW2011_GWC1_47_15]
MKKQTIKTPDEIKIMAEGGRLLAEIREKAAAAAKSGVTTEEIDRTADELIIKTGGKASFKLVPGYKHATCIIINDEVVHGIPGKRVIQSGDIVGIDVGLYYKGFHTDTAVTVRVEGPKSRRVKEIDKFLETGRLALKRAVEQARPGKRVADISRVMQETVEAAGYSAVRALTGHGVGRELHEEPTIPCFTAGPHDHSPALVPGMVLALEIMFNEGLPDVVYKNDDGWTIGTADGKISGLFEHTVAVTARGPLILTQRSLR